jgi:hypothetical protein
MQPEPDLLAKATVLCNTERWLVYPLHAPEYIWLNSHEILYQAARPDYPSDQPTWLSQDNRWYSEDVVTHKVKDRVSLTKTMRTFAILSGPIPDPKGTFLLWSTLDGDNPPSWTITDLDGLVVGIWLRHSYAGVKSMGGQDQSYSNWTLDGNTILECECKNDDMRTLNVWRRDLSDLSKEIPLRALSNVEYQDRRPDGGLIDLGASRTAYFLDGGHHGGWKHVVAEWTLSEPSKAVRTTAAPLPLPLTRGEVSPDHRRLLWSGWSEENIATIWVSDLDGAGVRDIGTIPKKRVQKNLRDHNFGELHWIPGRPAISFIVGDNLYEANAD